MNKKYEKATRLFYDLTIIVHVLMLLWFINFLCPKFQAENLLPNEICSYIL